MCACACVYVCVCVQSCIQLKMSNSAELIRITAYMYKERKEHRLKLS